MPEGYPVSVFEGESLAQLWAWISDDITPSDIAQMVSWQPELARMQEEDAGWDWQELYNWYRANGELRMYKLECEGIIQGAIILDLAYHPGAFFVYVHRLCVAPWNRSKAALGRRFRPIGTLLLRQAVLESVGLGFKGHMHLHSLPGAASWYRRLGLKGGTTPSATSLERFILPPERAGSFLGWETVMKLKALGHEVAEPIS